MSDYFHVPSVLGGFVPNNTHFAPLPHLPRPPCDHHDMGRAGGPGSRGGKYYMVNGKVRYGTPPSGTRKRAASSSAKSAKKASSAKRGTKTTKTASKGAATKAPASKKGAKGELVSKPMKTAHKKLSEGEYLGVIGKTQSGKEVHAAGVERPERKHWTKQDYLDSANHHASAAAHLKKEAAKAHKQGRHEDAQDHEKMSAMHARVHKEHESQAGMTIHGKKVPLKTDKDIDRDRAAAKSKEYAKKDEASLKSDAEKNIAKHVAGARKNPYTQTAEANLNLAQFHRQRAESAHLMAEKHKAAGRTTDELRERAQAKDNHEHAEAHERLYKEMAKL